MSDRLTIAAVMAVGVGYLTLFGWAIINTTYDVWGALVVIPPLGFAGVMLIRWMFRGEWASLRPLLYAGLGAKLMGTALRYWVGFEAYGGSIDAGRYHRFAVDRHAAMQDGLINFFDLLPEGTGTPYVEDVTALLYAITGPSRMGGFVVFGFIGYIGVLCFVKAAVIAIPGLATYRYAALAALAPSLAYWPASIGKESLMILGLGVASLGVARFLATGAIAIPVSIAAAGMLFTAAVRPHMAGLWMAGIFPGLLVYAVHSFRAPRGESGRKAHQGLIIGVIGLAAVALVVFATAAVRYLDPDGDDAAGGGESVTSILDETSRRTAQARSNFDPPNVQNPANWPFASVRTLTRPLLIEARGSAQLFTALELTFLIGLAVLGWRRLANLPKLLLTVPYVTFAMTTLFLGSLAFSSFANLGVLARQKSLIFPFLLLVVCLPERPRRAEHDPDGERARRRAEFDANRSLAEELGWAPTAKATAASLWEPRAPAVAVSDSPATLAGWHTLDRAGHNTGTSPDAAARRQANEDQNSSMSPNPSAQLGNGGWPALPTARQVSIGPPPGNGANPVDDLWAPRRMA